MRSLVSFNITRETAFSGKNVPIFKLFIGKPPVSPLAGKHSTFINHKLFHISITSMARFTERADFYGSGDRAKGGGHSGPGSSE